MSVFSKCRIMPATYTVESSRPFNAEELTQILYVKCVPSAYGYSAECHYIKDETGEVDVCYIPLARDSEEFVILNAIQIKDYCTLLTLRKGCKEDWVNEKDEDADRILRIKIEF
jgi:hypothetical protein